MSEKRARTRKAKSHLTKFFARGDSTRLGWVIRSLFMLAVGSTFLLAAGLAFVFSTFSAGLPEIVTPADYRPFGVTRVLGGAGASESVDGRPDELLGEFYKERRYVIPYEKIPESVVRAFISAEDDQFFEHQGVNPAAILRAALANLRAGHVVQGGSTITQQVAKSFLGTSERSFVRKIRELILASRLERNLTKEQILYLYLNQIYLGNGAYGVQAAARSYFNKDVWEVTPAEAAILAGMPQAPGKYSPLVNPDQAKRRQRYVLRRMAENRYLTASEMSEAAEEPIKVWRERDLNDRYASYYVEQVRRYVAEKFGEKALYEEGLTISVPTTRALSAEARKSVQEGLRAIDKRIGYRGPIKHYRSQREIEENLIGVRKRNFERCVPYEVLNPEGELDMKAALRMAGFPSEARGFSPGGLYEGIVTSVNDAKKSAGVMLGAVRAELSLSTIRWARLLAETNGGYVVTAEPNSISRVLKVGDHIWVTPVAPSGDGGLQVTLEQIPDLQAALVSIETGTGSVLAMEGGYDFKLSEFNRAMQAKRQPGSAFKPLIFSAALEQGFTPASIIVDSPIVYGDEESGKWKPTNYEEKFYGDTSFRQALIKSRNVPTIKLVQSIQVGRMIDYARRLGLTSEFNRDLSISLGSGAVSLLELTQAYAVFPRLGRRVQPILIRSVKDRDGRVLEETGLTPPTTPARWDTISAQRAAQPESVDSADANWQAASEVWKSIPNAAIPSVPASVVDRLGIRNYPLSFDQDQIMDARVAYVMSHLMKEVVTYGTGAEARNLGRPAAGKTGTTNDSMDAWFMGFTPHVLTGVWVGYDQQRPIGAGETGAKAALPIWLNFMKLAVAPYPVEDFPKPAGVVFASIDSETGRPVAPNSSRAIREAFIEGTEPTALGASEAGAPGGNSPGNPADAPGGGSGDFFKEDIE